jgi:signal transduction histidine kinase
MNLAHRLGERFLGWADSFLPAGQPEVELVRRVRVAVAQAVLGLLFTLAMAALYLTLGSRVSALALALVGASLAAVPWLVRRGISVVVIGNAMVGLTYCATLVVALHSGGVASPAVVWNFLFPLSVYAVCGRRSAVVWSVLAGLQIGGLYVASALGMEPAQDLREPAGATLQLIGHLGVLGAMGALLFVLDGARLASVRALKEAERAESRQRILDDMHDGVGSHLLGLLVEARAGTLREVELIACLETCLDDLRLIVDSLDPRHASLDAAFGALRARLSSRCEGLGVELTWDVAEEVVLALDPADGMHVLRALQEMITNALRHAEAAKIDIRLGALSGSTARGFRTELAVRDYGVGLRSEGNPRGRGMKSLQVRARKLGGALVIEPQQPGLRVAIELPG